MKHLKTDGALNLGGSASQMIDYNLRTSTRAEFIENLETRLTYRCRTVPQVMAMRCAQLIGLIYDQFGGDAELLDIAIEAINRVTKRGAA